MPDVTVDIAQGISAYGILPDQQFANVIWYTMGEAKRNAGDWVGAVTAFTNAGEYNDAKVQITETHYQHAQSLMKSGDYQSGICIIYNIKRLRRC